MVLQDTSITILTLLRSPFVLGTSVHRLVILCLLVTGHVKICGHRIKKQRILLQKRERGSNMCDMSKPTGGNMKAKKSSDKRYETIKPKKGGMKKPSASFKGYTYKDY